MKMKYDRETAHYYVYRDEGAPHEMFGQIYVPKSVIQSRCSKRPETIDVEVSFNIPESSDPVDLELNVQGAFDKIRSSVPIGDDDVPF
jgi:hypothetical protein